jgi:hypothetical protein
MNGYRPPGVAFAFAALALSCISSEVTPLGSKTYPSRGEHCDVDVFPATKPPYPYTDIASTRALCNWTRGRTACIELLKEDACQVGATTVYAFVEGTNGGGTAISATLARKTREAPKHVAADGQPTAGAASDGCSPPCSPGFACKADVCEPVCNPPCEDGEVCTRKRVCEPPQAAK